MDRTELLSFFKAGAVPLEDLKDKTLTSISVAPDGNLHFTFNKGEVVVVERNMTEVEELNYIEDIEVKPFSLTVRTSDGQTYRHDRVNEFITPDDLPALLTQLTNGIPTYKKLVVSGLLEMRGSKLTPNAGVVDTASGIFCCWYYRTLYYSMAAGAWRTVPFNTVTTSEIGSNIASMTGSQITLNKGRYLFALSASSGMTATTSCFAKYRLFNVTTNTALLHSPTLYATSNMAYESAGADFSGEIFIEDDNTVLQLQFRGSATCRLTSNTDWLLSNIFSLQRLI